MKNFLDIHQTDQSDLRTIIDTAAAMKSARKGRSRGSLDEDQPLKDQMVALIFEKPSTRTRVSFDVGVRQMGGQTLVLSGADMQLGHGETIADTARVLSRYVDLIMIRTFEEQTLHEMAEYATVPVINGLTNRSHPCQIMADIMTFEEHNGPIKGKKVVWSGDGNNVFALFDLWKEKKSYQEGITFYEEQLKQIKVEKAEVLGNDDAAEKFAREKYRMKKEGETVFIIVDSDGKMLD
jgi:ornithine carbamoyltransferase